MKKSVLYLATCLTIVFFSFKPGAVQASHVAGGEIAYEWIADSTYRVIFKFYRDCTGIAEPATQDLCVYNSCTNNTFTITMNKWVGPLPGGSPNGSTLAMGCSAYKTKCDSPASNIFGFKEWWYSAMITLPSRCSMWRFSVDINARNATNNLPQDNFYTEATFDNTGNRQGNSSPYFSVKPTSYVCVNMPFTFNNGAIDPNGDSIVTEVITPLSGTGSCTQSQAPNVTFTSATPPYSIPSNPIQTNNTFVTNMFTGQMSFTPTQQGLSVLDVRVKEYRNGVLIGSVMRESMIQVIPCSTSAPASSGPISVSGGLYSGGQVTGCINTPLSFSWYAKSSNPAAAFILSDNHTFNIPGASTSYTNQGKDSVRGNFSWTPAANDSGLKTLLINIKDSTCAPPGIIYYYTLTIPIYIWPKTEILQDTAICPGDTAHLSATNGGNYSWSILPGGTPGSLSCTNCQNPVAYPFATTQYRVTSNLTSYCPNSNKDTVTVSMRPYTAPSLVVTASDTNAWLGLNVTFTATPVNCLSPNNYYQWYMDGNIIQGANSNTWSSSSLKKTPVISCVMICNSNCASPKIAADSMSIHIFASIDDVKNANGISIYPNPNNGSFTITGEVPAGNTDAIPVEIYNAVGQLVYRDVITPANNKLNKTVQLPEMPAGIYHMRLKMADGMKVVQFSIQR